MKKSKTFTIAKISLAAMFLAIGWLLPLLTGQIPQIGNMLCPMHLPVMICGFLLGPIWGLIIGGIMPITRSLIFGMPPLWPGAVGMTFELAAYGFFCGLLLKLFHKKLHINFIASCYIALIISMILGRGIWGVARVFCAFFPSNSFTLKAFLAGAFINAWPAIILQIVLIPPLMLAFKNTKIMQY